MSVSDVMVIETAASDIVIPMRSGTLSLTEVRRQAANITNVSSIPIPVQIIQKINKFRTFKDI